MGLARFPRVMVAYFLFGTIDHVVVVPRRVIVPPLYLMHHMSPLIENILQYIRG